ncbi:MAG TPA: ABC transporter ATP-binding protein [Acidimicrobiales bacterium]|nr:ABC transporter ATP-binding protein [Acidimicrobiales bacterium]
METADRLASPVTELGTEPALRFERVGKVFDDGTRALADVTFAVMPGEFVSIVGPSGCGKSTLLRIASGLTPATSGRHQVASTNIGYVFQDPTLLPWRTVQANVELFGELHGIAKSERRRLATEAIHLVGLSGFEKHYPLSLSGGMKMRASLARSLTLKPPVFLFDEPFGAIDEITRDHLNIELMQLFGLERFTALFITHSINEAVYLSKRVHVMSARPGRIVATFEVPFDYPRQEDLRYESDFAELTGAVNHALREAHA